ncbi:MAG: prepilin-type N-terminal cleavage/methylation domain-containing protein [Phycisphaerales bacterium]|nr:prepilin-type N-terminal cleavage/methylation domain-containing protein [Phycisphaerales bacterium]
MRRGFTLIELLVVMSIIGVVMALFAPALAGARTSSRHATCAARLHQLGVLHFEQSWEIDRWAQSAYDLALPRFAAVAERGDHGYTGRRGSEGEPPGGSSNFARKLDEAEHASPAQPPSWRIPCPDAIPGSEQSWGLNWRFRGVKPDRLSAVDLIFGDSPYRLLVRGRDLAARHSDEVNFMYGDQHVATGGAEALKEDDLHRQMWRAAPVPAEYPQR